MNYIQKLVKNELEGHKAWQHANYISQFMRTPGSFGIHETIHYSEKKLNEYGLDSVFIIKYPSEEHGTEELKCFGWDVNDAILDIVEPVQKRITSYAESPTCIQHWSIPTPPEGVVAELVDVGPGVNEDDYQGKDVNGKIALASGDGHAEGNSQAYRLAVEKYGAIGLVTDNLIYPNSVRTRENHPNAQTLLRVPSREETGWAFVISHTHGTFLRSQLKKGPVKLKAFIDAVNYEAEGEELVGVIEGSEKPEQEIWFVAHSSGTKPGANCAGGVGLWIENARAIMTLITQGKVPRPKRTIKFLLGAEGGGLTSYLTARPDDVKKVVAAFVYCSVGNDQNECGSSLIMYKSAESIPSFINDLCIDTIDKVSKDGLPPFKDETKDIQLIRFNAVPYTPWSDNSRLMRLMVPSPLFMSWPARHFHTQFMTSDKLDPAVLKRCGEVTTSVALMLANAGANEARFIAKVVESKGKSRFMHVSTQAYSEIMDALTTVSGTVAKINHISEHHKGKIDYLANRTLGALESIEALEDNSSFRKELDGLMNGVLEAKAVEKAKIDGYKALFSKEV